MGSASPSLSIRSCSEGGLEDESTSEVIMSSPSGSSVRDGSRELADGMEDGDHRARLAQLKSHPLFADLQLTLALDCLQSKLPHSLLSDSYKTPKSPLTSDPGFCTVSDKIMEQHLNIQKTLLGVRIYFPGILASYHQMADQVECQRYKALAYNCHSDNVKHLINWFYDCERQLLIDKMQEMVSTLVNKPQTVIPKPMKTNGK